MHRKSLEDNFIKFCKAHIECLLCAGLGARHILPQGAQGCLQKGPWGLSGGWLGKLQAGPPWGMTPGHHLPSICLWSCVSWVGRLFLQITV